MKFQVVVRTCCMSHGILTVKESSAVSLTVPWFTSDIFRTSVGRTVTCRTAPHLTAVQPQTSGSWLCEKVGWFTELLIFPPKKVSQYGHSRRFFVVEHFWMKNLAVPPPVPPR